MATVKHQGGLDVLTQTTPIGNIARFRQHVERAVGRAVEPAMPNVEHRTLRERATDAAGVLVTHIPPTPGDPVQTADDHVFYIRAGDEFVPMPYDVLRRMFAGTDAPLIEPTFDSRLVKAIEDEWEIPLVVANLSSALGREVRVSVVVENPEACERVRSTGLNDLSTVNPGKTMFGSRLDEPVYRGLNVVIGTLFVTMKKEKRRLDLRIGIFADKMRARSWLMRVQLAQSGFAVNAVTSDFLY